MTSSRVEQVVLCAVLLVSVAGIVDAWVIHEPDLVVLFGVVLLLALLLLARTWWRRRCLPVRPDLVRWLRAREDLTGEPMGQIANRALDTYRLQLGEDRSARPSAARGGGRSTLPPEPDPPVRP